MANAVAAGLRGHEYQALIFWLQACHLLRSGSGVQRVAYEFDGPKAFDDVVVWYDPPVPAGGPDRVRVRHIQSKFKVSYEDSFGHADLIDPTFINATSVSLLERLRDAQRGISEDGTGVRFQIRTIARLRTDDPLHKMVNAHDRSFLVHRLLDGKTDKSDLGREIRKPWRERLGLATDEELRPILYPLEIQDGSRSLMDLRSDLAVLVDSVGLEPVDMTVSGCRYCSTILSLNNRGLNDFDRELFEQTCREEKLFRSAPTPRPNDRMRVSIRSFTDPGVDPATGNDRLLLLTRHYSARYIAADDGWRTAIQPEVTGFLVGVAAEGKPIELAIDAHASIAFLSGHVLHPKLGVAVHLIQKTAGLAPQPWSINGEVHAGAPDLEFTEVEVGVGEDIAIGISIARDLFDDVRKHIADNLPAVGRIVVGTPAGGASATAVRNGAHASRLADAISNHVVKTRSRSGWQGDLHLYLAAPNGLVFMLGQRSRGFGPTVLYEFDFERRVKGYTPSITINKDMP